MNAAAQITTKVSSSSTKALKEMARTLNNDMQDGADFVLDTVLDALMSRLPEAEFVAFCEELEAA